jgi:hypothetical protein
LKRFRREFQRGSGHSHMFLNPFEGSDQDHTTKVYLHRKNHAYSLSMKPKRCHPTHVLSFVF